MNKLFLSITLLVIGNLILAACAKENASTSVGVGPCHSSQVKLSVEIVVPEIEPVEAKGQRINFLANANPIGVFFEWTLTGEGKILNPNDHVIQYQAPLSVTVETDVTLSVTVIDPDTGCKAIDDITIKLLPPSILNKTPKPTPTHTLTSTHTPISPPIDTPSVTYTSTQTPTHTPTPTSTPALASSAKASLPCIAPPPLSSLPASETVIEAPRTNQPPTIDGCLDEPVWLQAPPLIYAVHPPANDMTTATIRLLWDAKYLYAGFEVSDTHLEDASRDDVWNGDSVAVIVDNGEQIGEYRYTLRGDINERHRLIADRGGTTASEAYLKGASTLNDPGDQDEGYSVEIRIPWARPVAIGDMIAADFLSVDHDQNPGKAYNHPTVFSKISWDGDQDVTTAKKSILLTNCILPVCVSNVKDGQIVPQRLSLQGEYTPEVSEDIWVFIETGGTYWPQSANPALGEGALKREGRWEVFAGFGGDDDVGRVYEILVTTANTEASKFLGQTIQLWWNNRNFPGLSEDQLPAGLTEYQRFTVRRGEEQYGPPPSISNVELAGQLSINEVDEGASMPQTFLLKGTADPEVRDTIWVLLYAPDGRFYPQSTNACQNAHTVQVGNNWQVDVYLGGPNDAGKPFDLVVVLADEEANDLLEETQRGKCRNGSYPGFLPLELPPGLDKKASVRVIQQ